MKKINSAINESGFLGLRKDEKEYAGQINAWVKALREGSLDLTGEQLIKTAILLHEKMTTVHIPYQEAIEQKMKESDERFQLVKKRAEEAGKRAEEAGKRFEGRLGDDTSR